MQNRSAKEVSLLLNSLADEYLKEIKTRVEFQRDFEPLQMWHHIEAGLMENGFTQSDCHYLSHAIFMTVGDRSSACFERIIEAELLELKK